MGAEFVESGTLIGFFLVIGAGVGVLSGLIGVGGGAALAPALYFTFVALDYRERAAHAAVGTALAVIAVVSLVGLKHRMAQGTLDRALLRRSAPWLALGAAVGAGAAAALSDGLMTGAIGVAAFATALLVLFAEGRGRGAGGDGPRDAVLAASFGGVGAATALAGLGGGAFAAPLYRSIGAPSTRANATATGAALAVAAPAALLYVGLGHLGAGAPPPFSFGDVNLAATAVIAPMILACAPLGARLILPFASRAPRLLFAFILAMVALTMVRRVGLA